MLKTLTLTQPWASLVAIGAKRIETRSFPLKYRGPLAIHAAKAFPRAAQDLAQNSRTFRNALGWPNPEGGLITQRWLEEIAACIKSLPLGRVLATTEILDCKRTGAIATQYFRATDEFVFGNYECGRYGFILGHAKPLPDPDPVNGALGLWNWDDEAYWQRREDFGPNGDATTPGFVVQGEGPK